MGHRDLVPPKPTPKGLIRSAPAKVAAKAPQPQTVGRIKSVSGTLTRPKVSPVPPPTAQPSPPGDLVDVPRIVPDHIDTPESGTAPGGVDKNAIEIEAIEAAIAAIEAQFGLTREQLLADESEIGRTYRLLISQVNRAREQSIEAVVGNALERGIVRSGILAKNVAEVETFTAESVANLALQQAAQQASVQTAIQQAESTAAQAKLTAAQQRGGQVLSLEELQALIDAGLA